MKKFGLLFVSAATLTFAQVASAQMKTETVKAMCDAQIAAMSASKPVDRGCGNFMQGVKDEMDGELSWADDAHRALAVGNWQDGVSLGQIIKVFMKYVNDNPATLNKPAIAVLRQSVEAVGLYTYTPVTVGNTQTAQ
jgi:hypothetical protein